MKHLPLFFDVRDRLVVVIGGGQHAARRAKLALEAGARVHVVTTNLSANFEELQGFVHLNHEFTESDLDGADLVFAVSVDDDKNTTIAGLAQARHIPVNSVDRRDISSVIMPSIVDRDPITIAISSAGESPVMARELRAKLESWIPSGTGDLARFFGNHRKVVMAKISNQTQRRRFWEDINDGPIAECVLAGRIDEADQLLNEALASDRYRENTGQVGEVYLVGSGPGNPELLTFRALRLMQKADIVLHDRLVANEILDLVRKEAEFFYVGKKRSNHVVPQDQISRMLVDQARLGKRVLRLKGGDPFMFGRGGEEMELLAQERIPFQVVPGITAANGCAAYTGIPLTHRDHAQACVFVTGHTKDGGLKLNWKSLVEPNQTVVVYMGLNSIRVLMRKLIEHGAPAERPAAVIVNGTRENQQVITGQLYDIAKKVETSDLRGPAMIIIGTVVNLRDELAWK